MITTYNMLAGGKKSEQSSLIIQQMQQMNWGLVLLDEVRARTHACTRKDMQARSCAAAA